MAYINVMTKWQQSFFDGLLRVGAILPFTLWPVMIWIQSFGAYSRGRHSVEALFSVGSIVLPLALAFSIIGFLAACSLRTSIQTKFGLVALLIVNCLFLCSYIDSNAVAYA